MFIQFKISLEIMLTSSRNRYRRALRVPTPKNRCSSSSFSPKSRVNCAGCPFVFETGGRWGTTADAWIKTLAPTDPAERSEALAQLRYQLATSLQRSVADAILTAYN